MRETVVVHISEPYDVYIGRPYPATLVKHEIHPNRMHG